MTGDENPWAAWERNFIQQMVRLREARQMTQTDVARELKSYGLPFHQPTIQRIEAGERPVRLNEAHLIARVLGVNLASMTEEARMSDREVRYSIDRLRLSTDRATADFWDVLGPWLNEVEGFVLEIVNRLSTSLHPPDGEPGQPDKVDRWALAWGFKVLRAYKKLRAAQEGLFQIGAGYQSENIETADLMQYLSYRCHTWGGGEAEAASYAHPNELYESFPELPKPRSAESSEGTDAAEEAGALTEEADVPVRPRGPDAPGDGEE